MLFRSDVAVNASELLKVGIAGSGSVSYLGNLSKDGGGAQIYREAWPQTQELDICEVDQSPEADAFFPAVDADEWVEIARDGHDGYAFVRYRRRAVDEG